jgi:hypothetical protein
MAKMYTLQQKVGREQQILVRSGRPKNGTIVADSPHQLRMPRQFCPAPDAFDQAGFTFRPGARPPSVALG